jgi:transposase
MTMRADIVDVVIGVNTHQHTHTAAVVSTAGAVLEHTTETTDPDDYAAIVAVADRHPGLRAWAIESTNGYGAGLARFLAERGEWVIELDRPTRPARRHGAKSDPIDAVRAAREALAREHLAAPRSDGERAAFSVRLAARRSAVEASTIAQRQLHAVVIAAPETPRGRLRNRSTTEDTTLTPLFSAPLTYPWVAELPAAILARLLGIHIGVAVKWQRASSGDWTNYAADVSRRDNDPTAAPHPPHAARHGP